MDVVDETRELSSVLQEAFSELPLVKDPLDIRKEWESEHKNHTLSEILREGFPDYLVEELHTAIVVNSRASITRTEATLRDVCIGVKQLPVVAMKRRLLV